MPDDLPAAAIRSGIDAALEQAVEDFIEGPAYEMPFETPADSYGMGGLHVDLGTFEGPLDLLLKLAREQKVDLTQISILALADQYLDYIHGAQKLRLEVAADYLVMAAWLAFLKSRLLLPAPAAEEPNPAEMAALLAFQLQRLAAMQKAGASLFALPQLGIHYFRRGAASKRADKQAANENRREGAAETVVWSVSLYELLSAMAAPIKRQEQAKTYRIAPLALYSIEEAYTRLTSMLGMMPAWSALESFMPLIVDSVAGEDGSPGNKAASNLTRRSALAATFVASLELAKNGMLELRQESRFGHIYLRRREAGVPDGSVDLGKEQA